MTKDEIYERLAEVYLGKSEGFEEKKKKLLLDNNLIVNIILTVIIVVSGFYGLTAFLSHKGNYSKRNVIFALNNNPIRIKYNLNYPYPQVSKFSFPIPKVNAAKYDKLSFSMRGLEEGYPGVVKIVLNNERNETSFYFIKGVGLRWQKFNISLDQFAKITDWNHLTDISFVFESWNATKKKGIVLIDDLCFSNEASEAK